MKKLLLTLSVCLLSANSFAQSSTSVIIDSGKNDSSMNKADNIIERTSKDVEIITDKAGEWQTKIDTANTALKSSADELENVIDSLNERHEKYIDSETDPIANNSLRFVKEPVPVCSGDKPRLVYKSSAWHCVAAIQCSDVKNSNIVWEVDSTTGKCKRPATKWKTDGWTGDCKKDPYTESRKVNCVKEGTTTSIHDSNCSQPKPATSRGCIG